MTRFFFRLMSVAYVIGIFLFADSSVVSDLSPFNPYSLLHIPLYGILTFFLVFSVMPLKWCRINTSNASNLSNPSNSSNPIRYLLIAGFIALGVAVADEIHQAYVPGRYASILDIFLDVLGIAFVLGITGRLFTWKKTPRWGR